MIAEDVLERALGIAAEGYDLPDDAIERLRTQLAPSVADDEAPGSLRRLRAWRPTPHQWVVAGAASVVALIVLAFALGGAGGQGGGAESAGGAGHASSATSALRDVPALPGAAGGQPAGAGTAPKSVPSVAEAAPLAPQRDSALSLAGTAAGGPGASNGATSDKSIAGPLPPPGDSARVVKTGELDLQVSKGQVSHTLDRLTGLATLERGYISESSTSEGGDAPSGQVTMRVPVGSFETTVAKARGYGKVLSLQTSGKDVTAQYSDTAARIKALKATRATFLTILSRATTIGETLAVEQRITDVQTEIDQLQGRLNVLADQSELATLTVTVDQVHKPTVVARHHRSGLAKAVDTSVGRFVRGVEAIIGVIGPILLVVLVLVLGWLAATFGYRLLRRRLV